MAAPVIGMDGHMTHALVGVALSDRLSPAAAGGVGGDLKAAAARVSRSLGGVEATGPSP